MRGYGRECRYRRPTVGGRRSEPPESERVLVPILDGEPDRQSTAVAAALAEQRDVELVYVSVVTDPSRDRSELPAYRLREHHQVAKEVMRAAVDPEASTDIRGTIRVGRSATRVVLDAIETFHASAVVLETPAEWSRLGAFGGDEVRRIASRSDCEVIVVNGDGSLDDVSSILLPVAGGPHSGLAVDVAHALATAHDAWIDLLHVVTDADDPDERAEAERYFDAARERLGAFTDVDDWLLAADDVADAIVEQSAYYDVVVLGAPQRTRLEELVFGSTRSTSPIRPTGPW
ncbi:universal stress protein [Halobacteriaceae archaeon GCM10025711]